MEGGPLLSDWWQAATADFIPYLNIEAQFDGAPDQGFLKKMGGRGFPYCTIIDPASGEVIWEVRPTDADVVKKAFEDARKLQSLMKASKAKPEDKALAASVQILSNLGRGQREADGFDVLDRAAKTEGLDKDVAARFEAWAVSKRFEDQMSKAMRSATSREEAAQGVLRLYESGVLPPEGHQGTLNYWLMVGNGAVASGKMDVAKKAHASAKPLVPEGNARAKKALDDLEAMINKP